MVNERALSAGSPARRVPLWLAAILSAAGGVAIFFSYPSTSVWWLALVGVALHVAALWNQRGRHGLWLGLLAGASFWFPLIDWLTLYLGPIPWLALGTVMVLWFALFGGLIAMTTRAISALRCKPWITVTLQSMIVVGLWVTREQVQSSWPYGGFGWGKLSHTQAEGPWLAVVSWSGFAGLSGIIALLAIVPVASLWVTGRRTVRVAPIALTAVLGVGLLFVPPALLPSHGERRIAAVQGNSKSGLFDDRESGDVIADHIRVTADWLDGSPGPVDAVVWPENSGEFQLPHTPKNLQQIRQLVERADAPFSVGSVLADPSPDGDLYTNSSLVFEPDSSAIGRYDKRYPVPFAEYMPHREFYRSLVPHLVDLVHLDYQHGTTPSVLSVGDFRAGHAICFDIVFDQLAQDMVVSDAEVVFAQTNNADFGFTDQSEQQLAIAKLRAVEMGRDVVHISTVATSEIVSRTGETLASIPQWQAGVMEADVALVSGQTPAITHGAWITGLLLSVGLGGAVFAVAIRFRLRLSHVKSSTATTTSG